MATNRFLTSILEPFGFTGRAAAMQTPERFLQGLLTAPTPQAPAQLQSVGQDDRLQEIARQEAVSRIQRGQQQVRADRERMRRISALSSPRINLTRSLLGG